METIFTIHVIIYGIFFLFRIFFFALNIKFHFFHFRSEVMLALFYLLIFDLLCMILHMHRGKNYLSITLHIAITK
jgi:hypothetical protein